MLVYAAYTAYAVICGCMQHMLLYVAYAVICCMCCICAYMQHMLHVLCMQHLVYIYIYIYTRGNPSLPATADGRRATGRAARGGRGISAAGVQSDLKAPNVPKPTTQILL